MATLASLLLPGLIAIVLFGYLILSYRRGTGLFNVKSGARRIEAEDADVSFDAWRARTPPSPSFGPSPTSSPSRSASPSWVR